MVKTHFVKYKENLQCTAPSALNDVLMNMTETLQTAVTEEIKKMEHVIQKKLHLLKKISIKPWMRLFKMCT